MMKCLKSLLFASVAVVTIGSCSLREEIEESYSSRTLTVHFSIDEFAGTKTYLDTRTVYWGKGEYVMLYYNDGLDNFAKSKTSSADANNGSVTASFDFDVSPLVAQKYTIGGLYPASCITGKAGRVCSVTLPGSQNAAEGKYDPTAYPLILRSESVSSFPTVWSGYFRRACALNKLTLTGVPEKVVKVEIVAPGKSLAGTRNLDFVDCSFGQTSNSLSTLNISYKTPLNSGDMDVWFTSWGVRLEKGEKLTIKVCGTDKVYTKTITASSKGISFSEGCLNSLCVDFSSIKGTSYTVADFASSMAGLVNVWESNYAVESVSVSGMNVKGHYIPEDTKIFVSSVSCGKAEIYKYALNIFQGLVAGTYNMDSTMPVIDGTYSWGTAPFNENSGNGGEFQSFTASLDLLRNYASRQLSYVATNKIWANFCTYNGNDDAGKGTPKISTVYGCCCLERDLIMMARFYKYLLDNNIKSNIATACASMAISSDLYGIGRIKAETTDVSLCGTAQSKTIKITSDGPWNAKSSASWLTISPSSTKSGTTSMTISVTKNTSSERSATISFTCDRKTLEISVKQSQTEVYTNPYTQKGMHTTQGPGYLGQRNGYNCGPHCLMQSIYKITGLDLSELTIAGWCGTSTSGTGHDGLNDGIATFNKKYKDELGYSLSIKWVSWSSLGSTLAARKKKCGEYMANPNTAVFIHMNYRNEWGHYEAPYYIDVDSSNLKVLNSLGDKASGGGYLGYIETRSWTNQVSYINGCVSSYQVCIISKQ